jgi:hypothetical protein
MKPYKVRNHKGGSIVAEFETQPEAAAYIQSQDNPLLYVDLVEPRPVVQPREPDAVDKFLAEHGMKVWFRYPLGGVLIWIGLMFIDLPQYGWMGYIVIAVGCLCMFELALLGVFLWFVYLIFSSLGNLSIPGAIIFGACIIAYAIYKKNQ